MKKNSIQWGPLFSAGFTGLLLTFCLSFTPLFASEIESIISSKIPPDGVVFEIAESAEGDLQELLPKVLDAIARIRRVHPETEFAVVSHGREEFALQTQNQNEYSAIHKNVISLVNDDVPVYVCETHAGWYGVTAEDFPDYVEVAPTGPGQISLYEEMGYQLIRIE